MRIRANSQACALKHEQMLATHLNRVCLQEGTVSTATVLDIF